MKIEDEAVTLANVVTNQKPGEPSIFNVNPEFHGQEHRLIELAQRVRQARGDDEIQMQVRCKGTIDIEA